MNSFCKHRRFLSPPSKESKCSFVLVSKRKLGSLDYRNKVALRGGSKESFSIQKVVGRFLSPPSKEGKSPI